MTEEQQKKLNKLKYKFLFKCFFNGLQHAFMAVVANCVLVLGTIVLAQNPDYAGDAEFIKFIGSVAIGIFILVRVLAVHRENVEDLEKEVAEIVK